MGRASTTTYTCDICGDHTSLPDEKYPVGWVDMLSRGGDVCRKCVNRIRGCMTLDEAKAIVKQLTPPARHQHGCTCQECRPWAD
jgi:hypothetical protein